MWRKGNDSNEQYINSTAHIEVPPNHVVVISLTFLNLRIDSSYCHFLTFELHAGSLDNRVWGAPCSGTSRRPRLQQFDTDALYVVLEIRNMNGEIRHRPTDFKLVFSFHVKSTLLKQLPDGMWNCSVPHWRDFWQHLGCNMMRECEGGEDEAGCEYYDESEACGPGLISAAGGCYQLAESRNGMTKHEAATECQERGGYLLSLNTPEELESISELLLNRIPFDTIFLGLQYRNPALPQK